MQMLDVYTTIANHGMARPPRLVAATVDADGKRHDEPLPAPHQVVSPATADAVTGMLKKVVTERHRHEGADPRLPGGGQDRHRPEGALRHRRVQRVVRRVRPGRRPPAGGHRGDRLARRASIYGADAAAPVFQQIMRFALTYERVPTIVRPRPEHGRPSRGRDRRPVPCTSDPVTEPRGRPRVRWHDLLAGLDGPGAVAGVELTGDPDVEIAAITHDSRRVDARRLLRVHPRRASPTATTTRPKPSARGAVALLVERPLPARRSPRPGAERAGRARSGGGHALRPPVGGDAVLGVTGTNGKTTTTYLLEAIAAARRRPRRRHRHRRRARRGRVDRRAGAHHARGERPPGAARADARRRRGARSRWRCRRTRSTSTASTACSSRRCASPTSATSTSTTTARSTRTSRRRRGCSRRASHAAAAVNVDDARGAELAARARDDGPRRRGPTRVDDDARRRRRGRRRRSARDGTAATIVDRRAGRRIDRPTSRSSARSTSPTPSAAAATARAAGLPVRRGRRRARRPGRRARPVRAGRRRPALHRARRLRPHARRPRPGARRRPPAGRAPAAGWCACSAAAATATRPSARSWARRWPPAPTSPSSPPTTPARRTRRRSPTRCSPASPTAPPSVRVELDRRAAIAGALADAAARRRRA